MDRVGRRGGEILLLLSALTVVQGCATYTDHVGRVHVAVDGGDYEKGIDEINSILGVGSVEELPERWSAHEPLAALERGVLLQSLGRYELSARDLAAAETELEFLDIKLDTPGNIGKYIYNDSAEVYKTPPTERLSLNAINMLNYLAVGNLQGASVEARRFTVMRDYLEALDAKTSHGVFGSYLSGFVFERLGETARALRYYDEAIAGGELGSLGDPVVRLAANVELA